MPGWDEELRTYLFTEGSITEAEEGGEESSKDNDTGLGIGKIK
jgi:hypothetical protein